jgi:phenylalanyl-tRNA synthetase beta subunit
MPTMIRIIGHHWAMSERIGIIHPRLDRRKMIPNPIRMYAEIADLDFMMVSP